jgi:TIR domain
MSTALEQLDRPSKVFLSYAREDRGYAERLRRILVQSVGARVFSDDMLSTGERWYERVLQELREADIFVVIGTPRSSGSESVLQELGAAWAIGKPLVVVTAEEGTTWQAPVESRMIEQISLPELEQPGMVEHLFARLARPRAEGSGNR